MIISQVLTSGCLSFFKSMIQSKYELHEYNSLMRPAFFFGCYSPADVQLVLRHRSMAVVIWGGSDVMQLDKPYYEELLKAVHVRHIAISGFVSKDLLAKHVKHIQLPICPTNFDLFSPTPLGDKVYMYSCHRRPSFYGLDLLVRVKRALPEIKIILGYSSPPDNVSREELPGVYAQCFLGLRLTPHDGLSNTVVELGLMGRRCVWNEGFPGAIRWSTAEDVIAAIRSEHQRVGMINLDQAKAVMDFLRLPTGWNTTEFYEW